jgi:lysophospholipase L1-like esterase
MFTYLALGDSYTIGEGVEENGRWPLQLAQALREEGIDLANPHIIAQTGWTTDELNAAIGKAELPGKFDLVSLLIGVNNQYRERLLDEYRLQFAALLERAIGFAGGRTERVMVLSIPDWGVTSFAQQQPRSAKLIGEQIDVFNATAHEVCKAAGVAFIDITPVSRECGGNPEMLAADGLHPSATMYAQWTKLALPVAKSMLSQERVK